MDNNRKESIIANLDKLLETGKITKKEYTKLLKDTKKYHDNGRAHKRIEVRNPPVRKEKTREQTVDPEPEMNNYCPPEQNQAPIVDYIADDLRRYKMGEIDERQCSEILGMAQEPQRHPIIIDQSYFTANAQNNYTDNTMQAKTSTGIGVFTGFLGVIIVGFIVFFLIFFSGVARNSKSSEVRKTATKGGVTYPVLTNSDALSIAQAYVKDQLKAPSTAKFSSNLKDYTFINDADTWTVSGYVDAQNSFGTYIRSSFTTKFRVYRENGKDMAHMIYTNVE